MMFNHASILPTVTQVWGADLPHWLRFFTLQSANVVYVLLGCVALGIGAGLIGSFSFLRKRSLIGDALAHAALPGVCMAFILSGTRDPWIILLGATVSCWLGAISIDLIVRHTRCKEDSALGMVLSVYFGIGIVLLTYIQQRGGAAQSGLDNFLFGQAAAMVPRDVWVISTVSFMLLLGVIIPYKELKLITFDPEFARAIGMPVKWIEVYLATLVVLAVAIGLQAVGVVLMAALLMTPAAAARYWTHRLDIMLILAAAFGAVSGVLGAYVSYLSPKMPTGPWMVIAVTFIFIISLLFAPERGMVARWRRQARHRNKTLHENVLRTLYLIDEGNENWGNMHSMDVLMKRRTLPPRVMGGALSHLKKKGLVQEPSDGNFRLTERGIRRAARLTRLHRLWELYLTRKLELPSDHVHADAEEIEHIITPEMERELAATLENPEVDPHRRSVPGPTETVDSSEDSRP